MTTKDQFNFSHRFRVRFAEADPQGVVFNAHYLTYFDTAITEYLRVLPYQPYDETGYSMPFHTVKAVVNFHGPCHADDEIDVFVRVAKLGRSSMTYELSIYRKDEDDLLSLGEIIWVHADPETHKSAPLPADLRGLIESKERFI